LAAVLPAAVPGLSHLTLDLYDTGSSAAADAVLAAVGPRLSYLELLVSGGAVLPYGGVAACCEGGLRELRLGLCMGRSAHLGPFRYGNHQQQPQAVPSRRGASTGGTVPVVAPVVAAAAAAATSAAGLAGAAAVRRAAAAGLAGGGVAPEGSATGARRLAPDGRPLAAVGSQRSGPGGGALGSGRPVPPAVAAIARLPRLARLELCGPALERILDPPYRLLGLSALTALTRLRLDLPADLTPPDPAPVAGGGGGGHEHRGGGDPEYGSGDGGGGGGGCVTAGWRLGPLLASLGWLRDLDLGLSFGVPPEALQSLAALAALTQLRCGTILTPPPRYRARVAGWQQLAAQAAEVEGEGEAGADGLTPAPPPPSLLRLPMPPALEHLRPDRPQGGGGAAAATSAAAAVVPPTPPAEPLHLALAGDVFAHEHRSEAVGRPEEVAQAVQLLLGRLRPAGALRRLALQPFGRSPARLEGPHAAWLSELAPLAGIVEGVELAAFGLAPGDLDALRVALPGL
ncbi:hypothetical protein TSOC_014565, partial [Tetrabaena socialis]